MAENEKAVQAAKKDKKSDKNAKPGFFARVGKWFRYLTGGWSVFSKENAGHGLSQAEIQRQGRNCAPKPRWMSGCCLPVSPGGLRKNRFKFPRLGKNSL
mgnify:CR=1 FL=1